VVVELECGVTVYPAREAGDRWRAVWYEGGRRRQCESVSEDELAGRLEQVIERLTADAPNLERPGADLIAVYLCPDRLPAREQWSRKHAHTQRRLCERFAVLVIGAVACQDIRVGHMQEIVSAPSSADAVSVVLVFAAGSDTSELRERLAGRQRKIATQLDAMTEERIRLTAQRALSPMAAAAFRRGESRLGAELWWH
jgi:hypothetical protein